MSKLQEKPLALKREHPALQKMKFIYFFYVCGSVADPYPGFGAFLTPGSGMGKKSGSGSGMNNPDHISESLRNNFLGLKYLNSLMRIQDPEWKNLDPGYGIEKIRIRNTGLWIIFAVLDPDPIRIRIHRTELMNWFCGVF